MAEDTYAQDLALLKRHTDVVELALSDRSRVAVVPAWQGRVMTSTLAGESGASYGWLNRAFIESARHDDPRFNNYGGEDRFWLGPEAGQFGLWFAQGEPFDLEHWSTPPGLTRGAWAVSARDGRRVTMAADFEVANYSGTVFACSVERTINTLDLQRISAHLGTDISDAEAVGFESVNALTNAGRLPWSRLTGLVSVWTLGMMRSAPDAWAIVPVRAGDEAELGPRSTTDYFGALPGERCRLGENFVALKTDGRYRSKIGVSSARATGLLGSYHPRQGALTIVQFNLPAQAAGLPYVNSLWELQQEPFAGDAVNCYNDTGDGASGTFYELETSSPAAELAPGKTLVHTHRTYHFAGEAGALRDIARRALGVDVAAI